MRLYLIGSLSNESIPEIGVALREQGYDVFDDWFSPGPKADEYWREYELARGHTYKEALMGFAGRHVFEFDKEHLDACDGAVLVLPAGKSAHLELGYVLGDRRFGAVYFPNGEPAKWDVMYMFADLVAFSFEELVEGLP